MEPLESIDKYLNEENIIPRPVREILGEKFSFYKNLEREKELIGTPENDLKYYQHLAEKCPGLDITVYDLLRSAQREEIKFNLEYASKRIEPHNVVLSVGCNTGLYETYLAPLAKRMIYLDICKTQLDAAKARAERRNVRNTTFMHVNMNSTGMPKDTIDCLLCFDALKEMSARDIHPFDSPYMDLTMREFNRVLKKDPIGRTGKMIISVTLEYPKYRKDVLDYWSNEAEKLKLKIEKAGFNGNEIQKKYWAKIAQNDSVTFLFDFLKRD